MKVDPLTEDIQHPDSLYKTLNMLVSDPEDVEGRNVHPGKFLRPRQVSKLVNCCDNDF